MAKVMSEQGVGYTKELRYLELIIFFVPLAVSAMLMMASHSIVSSALARTSTAEVALAAFAVAQSISVMFESPCYNIRRMAVTLFDDQVSYESVKKVALSVLGIAIIAMMLVAFTPLGKFVFIGLVGIKPGLYPQVIQSFRVFMILPAISAMRSFYQGLIIVRRKTYIMTINIIIRLVVMLAITPVVLSLDFISGSAVGAVVLVTGISTEAILAFVAARNYKKTLPLTPKTGISVNVRDAWTFFIPIIAASFIQTFGRPSINAGLARVNNPETALAAYQVAYSFAWIFVAMAFSIHQMVIVFVEDSETYKRVRSFILMMGALTSGLLLIISFTTLGEWVLINIIGVSNHLAVPALKTIGILAFVPLVMSVIEMYAGLLMLNKRTPTITLSKILNLTTLVVVVFSISTFFPQLGGMLAGISMLCGYLVELSVVFWRSKDVIPNEDQASSIRIKEEVVTG